MLSWSVSWGMTVASWLSGLAILLTSIGYVRLAIRRPAGSPWPARRVVSWWVAATTLWLAVGGPVAVYAERLFWVHMVQHLMLIMVVPVTVVWAQPIRLVRESAGPGAGAWLDALLERRPVRWATGPVSGLALYSGVVVLTHLTGFQQVSATHGAVRAAELGLYLVSGWLLYYPLLGADLGPWTLPYPLRLVVLFIGMGADTLTGVALMLTSHDLAPAYAAARPDWGPGPMEDEQVAGAIMWFGGDLIMMLLMILVAVAWGRAGNEDEGLGSWLEGARRRSLLGSDWATDDEDGSDHDVDSDERALKAYNEALAALHGRATPGGGAAEPREQR